MRCDEEMDSPSVSIPVAGVEENDDLMEEDDHLDDDDQSPALIVAEEEEEDAGEENGEAFEEQSERVLDESDSLQQAFQAGSEIPPPDSAYGDDSNSNMPPELDQYAVDTMVMPVLMNEDDEEKPMEGDEDEDEEADGDIDEPEVEPEAEVDEAEEEEEEEENNAKCAPVMKQLSAHERENSMHLSILPVSSGREIREGDQFQVAVEQWPIASLSSAEAVTTVDPDADSNAQRRDDLCLWRPTEEEAMSDELLEEYIQVAIKQFAYNVEQALGLLHWCKFELKDALVLMGRQRPYIDKWTSDEERTFERAFIAHGKSFERIQKRLPDRSIPELVNHYYLWKKAHKFAEYFRCFSDYDSSSESIDGTAEISLLNGSKESCLNCKTTIQESGIVMGDRQDESNEKLCPACELYKRLTDGDSRPVDLQPGALRRRNEEDEDSDASSLRSEDVSEPGQQPSTRPNGIIKTEDLNGFAGNSASRTSPIVRANEADDEQLRRRRRIRPDLRSHHRMHRPPEDHQHPTEVWTPEEKLIVVKGFHRCGKDFTAIAEDLLGTKTERMVRNFYDDNRVQYRLDYLINLHNSARNADSKSPSRRTETSTSPSAEVEGGELAQIKEEEEEQMVD